MGRGVDGSPTAGPQPDWHANCTVNNNAIAAQKGSDASISRTSAGIFVVLLGSGGVEQTESKVDPDYDGAAGLTCQVVHTDATHKTINFTAGSHAAATPPPPPPLPPPPHNPPYQTPPPAPRPR